MKILHVTECVGGGVCRALDQIPGRAPDHQHHLLSVNPGVQNPTGRGFLTQAALPPGHIRRVLAVRRLVRDLKPDIIHAHSSWAGFYTRALRLPGHVVYQPHGYALELGGPVRRAVFTLAEKLLAMRRTSVAVLSAHEFRVAGELSEKSRRVLLPNTATVSAPVAPLGIRSRRVVMVGRLGAQKDPLYFLRLSELVSCSDDSIEFVWIGAGDTQLQASLELGGIRITGWLPDAKLIAELATAGLYAHSSRYEGFPLSVLDAAVCGLPILARAIVAFEGSPIAQVGTVAEHADAICAFFKSGDRKEELMARNDTLLKTMNSTYQAAALERLYDVSQPGDPRPPVDAARAW